MNGKVVFTLDKDGTYTWICKAVEKVSGYKQEEFIGRSAFDFIHPEDKENIQSHFPFQEEEYRESAFRVIDKNGDYIQIISRTIRTPDGAILGVFDRRKDDRE
jgi:PAS domain S-box-containing protein